MNLYYYDQLRGEVPGEGRELYLDHYCDYLCRGHFSIIEPLASWFKQKEG